MNSRFLLPTLIELLVLGLNVGALPQPADGVAKTFKPPNEAARSSSPRD